MASQNLLYVLLYDMAITTRDQDFSARYNDLVEQAGLAQTSAVRGCMVIKPYGYAIWENMQKYLDAMFKATGHQNAYFPLFIPKSFFSKEAKHVAGFAKEAAIVTHYRLKTDEKTQKIVVDPEAKLEEELIVRPTSETIIWDVYRDWIKSYRDLPILVNQRANVVRWEMRTRLFLRSSEFLWQEGHTAHATREEALEETIKMRKVYQDFFNNFLAISPATGEKSENERFAGADATYTLEAYMQDGKSLQACTSHFLAQNFGKAFDVSFINKENKPEYARATSRGASTRMIGGLIMSHSDDKGLVLPPAIAPYHLVIIPIGKTEEEREFLRKIISESFIDPLKGKFFTVDSAVLGQTSIPIQIRIDWDEQKTPGWKYNEYELKGVPLRVAIGKRDLETNEVELYRRDTGTKEKIALGDIGHIINTLEAMQKDILAKNKALRENNTVSVDTYEDFKKAIKQNKFVLAHWDGTVETEELIKQETKATIRCIPKDAIQEDGICIRTGKTSMQRVLFANAY